jgi:MOSC domain-containing protein
MELWGIRVEGMSEEVRVSGLFTYPVKSCAGLSHASVSLDDRGPLWDRRWMVVGPDGVFLSQRQYPRLAVVQPSLESDALVLRVAERNAVRVPLGRAPGETRRVRVWQDDCDAWDEGDEAARLLSDHLGAPSRLVRMAEEFERPVDRDYAPRPAHTGFADAFPLLVVAEASLEELNRRLQERRASPVPVSRFRPNVVLTGSAPFAEDAWKTIRIGETTLDLVKPCGRCTTTRVDQARGVVHDPREPLATLATFRLRGGEVIFGHNAIHRVPGRIAVGEAVDPTA